MTTWIKLLFLKTIVFNILQFFALLAPTRIRAVALCDTFRSIFELWSTMFDSTTGWPGLLLLMVVMSCLTRPGVAGYLLSMGAGAPRLVLIPLAAQMTLRGSSLFFCGLSILFYFFCILTWAASDGLSVFCTSNFVCTFFICSHLRGSSCSESKVGLTSCRKSSRRLERTWKFKQGMVGRSWWWGWWWWW